MNIIVELSTLPFVGPADIQIFQEFGSQDHNQNVLHFESEILIYNVED